MDVERARDLIQCQRAPTVKAVAQLDYTTLAIAKIDSSIERGLNDMRIRRRSGYRG